MNYISNGPAFNSGIAALSGYLKKHGLSASLMNVTEQSVVGMERRCRETVRPDVVAFSVHTPHWDLISKHISVVKKATDALILCGGYHPTLCPDEVIDHPDVDVLCRGEGEKPLFELLNCLENKKPYHKVEGLWVKKRSLLGSKIYKNPVPPPLALDELPYWDRDLFFESGLSARDFSLTHVAGFPLASGRGCPYSCSFCNNASFIKMYKDESPVGKNYIRKRSIDGVIEECRFLMERYGATRFEFWDEMFASDRQWTVKFCEQYQKEVAKPFITALRVERAHETVLKALYDAGCKCVFVGVETGNEEYRKKYLNRSMSNETIKEAFDASKRVGLERFAWVMLGLPEETPAMVQETIDFLLNIQPDIIGWSVYHPLPGTELYRYCREKGYLSSEDFYPYYGAPEYNVPALNQPSISRAEITELCNRFRGLEQLGFRVNQ